MTSGPWFVGTQNDALFIINRPPRPSHDDMADIRDVQVIAKLNDCKGDDDARLLAAAPDLLAALKLYVDDGRCPDCLGIEYACAHAKQCTLRTAVTAIAKAEGKHP